MSCQVATPALHEKVTVWGLTPEQLHDRYWASRGVQVIRQGSRAEVFDGAELYLLLDPESLVLFRLRALVETLSWLRPRVLVLRLSDSREKGYREETLADEEGTFAGFRRIYDASESRRSRAALTPHPDVSRAWQGFPDPEDAWIRLRSLVPKERRAVREIPGSVFAGADDTEVAAYLTALVAMWSRPDVTVPRARQGGKGVWKDSTADVAADVVYHGPAWIGAGRHLDPGSVVLGPAVMWDDPQARPRESALSWWEIEPVANLNPPIHTPRGRLFRRFGKRLFDFFFALFALALTLPLYPFIALAILLEDGWPVFFAHRRETLGGREFPCLKFRSMRKDADRVKAELAEGNLADGPQFFLKDDPRSTRVGRILRAAQLDELPQFLNVLVGQMAIVGPRPSPRAENQYCPAWREARLSLRPGITGLWQVRRTREEGHDFQEWIRYDIEYVERATWRTDLWILWRTILVVFLGRRE